jgi:hypothetical protein
MSVITILHSIYGRKVGVDVNGYLATEKAVRSNSDAATSGTSGTNLKPFGITVMSSAETTWTLDAPLPGVRKTIKRNSASTATTGVVSLTNGSVVASTATFATAISMNGGAAVVLEGLSSTSWALVGTYGNVVLT